MSETLVTRVDIGPTQKTGDVWYFGARPSESLDAAEVTIVARPVIKDSEADAAPRPD